MIAGIPIEMDGKELVVPPLTLRQMRELAPEIAELDAGNLRLTEPAIIAGVAKVVATAMRRNYPDLDTETVERMLDLGNAAAAFVAALTGKAVPKDG